MVALGLAYTRIAFDTIKESVQLYFEVTTNFTEYTPGKLYKCGGGFATVSVFPSPKNHLYFITEK